MNTIKQTFYIMPDLTEGPIGDCKTLTAAKTLAKKHGVSMIYVRHDGALNGSAMFVWDISEAPNKWSLLSADEEDFANYNRSQISEPQADAVAHNNFSTVHTLATKHVARVAVVDEGDMFDGISDDDICLKAAQITTDRYMRESQALTSPQLTCRLLQAHLGHLQSEQFHALFLDSQHRLIKHQVLSYGTIDGAAVYPREVVKAALKTNCAAVIFAHNHPSGLSDASEADKTITERLVKALASVDIRTLDHMIIGNGEFTSFAEKRWL